MASICSMSIEGTYINGESFSKSFEERSGTTALTTSLINFIDGVRTDLQTFTMTYCGDDTGSPCLSGSLTGLFKDCSSLTHVTFLPEINSVTDVSEMFWGCSSLISFSAPNWNMSFVTNMSFMFADCVNLSSLDVSNWDVSNVINMDCLFGGCLKLTSLDVSNWNVSNVTSMMDVFGNCEKLIQLNLSNWDISNVTDLGYIFGGCSNLKTIFINPNNWQLNSTTRTEGMFEGCTSLVGRKGTTYVSSKTDASYARVDGGSDLPGYFCGTYDMTIGNILIKDAYFRGQKVNKAILGRDLLDLKKRIVFTIDGITYKAEEGMNWREWVASRYNTGGYTINESNPVSNGGPYLQSASGSMILTSSGHDYQYMNRNPSPIANTAYEAGTCCFVAGTQVLTSLEGDFCNIEDIKIGDEVVSYNIETGENYLTTVKNVVINPTAFEMAKIEFESGKKLEMTDYHPLYTTKGWASITDRQYSQLEIGDLVKTEKDWDKIINIELYISKEPIITYTLDVQDSNEMLLDNEINDNFYANGIVVHNAGCK